MASFYKKLPGVCLSATIDKYIYVSANHTKFGNIRSMYDTTENVKHPNELQNSIVKNTLKYFHMYDELTISSIADIPSHGSGLGSSSAFTVGLVNALSKYTHTNRTSWELADIATNIEINLCGHPIGKQDQYAAAYGGLNLIRFNCNDTVTIESHSDALLSNRMFDFQEQLLLVHSGQTHNANKILAEQQKNVANDEEKFRSIALNGQRAETGMIFLQQGKYAEFAELLSESWRAKKKYAGSISNDHLDEIYDLAMKSGAIGGKLLGAGGGGFFLFYVPHLKQDDFIQKIKLPAYKVRFTEQGSTAIEF